MTIDVSAFAPDVVPAAPLRSVFLVNQDERANAVLASYLEARGWRVSHFSNARCVIRKRATDLGAPPIVVLQLDEDDTDSFELLGALAAGVFAARVIVCARGTIEGLASLGVERVLASPYRFSDLAAALEEMRQDSTLAGGPR